MEMENQNNSKSEITEEIVYQLRQSSHPHLADCVDIVPERNQLALYNFICDQQHNRVQKVVIAFQVAEDVGMIVNGFPDRVEFSKEYLKEPADENESQ